MATGMRHTAQPATLGGRLLQTPDTIYKAQLPRPANSTIGALGCKRGWHVLCLLRLAAAQPCTQVVHPAEVGKGAVCFNVTLDTIYTTAQVHL